MSPEVVFLLVVFDGIQATEVAFTIADRNDIPSDLDEDYCMEPDFLEWITGFFQDGCEVIHCRRIDGAVTIEALA